MNTNIQFIEVDGIKCFNLDNRSNYNDYNPEHFETLFKLESKNFWFVARNEIIKFLFNKYLGNSPATVLEIGCGTGYVLSSLLGNKNYKLAGAEFYLEGLFYAKKRLPSVDFFQLDARKIPFKEEFDVIGAFDVIEHVEEDVDIIKGVYQALKDKGLFFLSVPQHKWLWSNQDIASGHKRRYERPELVSKLLENGFEILFMSSYVSILLPLMIFSRKRFKPKVEESKYNYSELNLNPVINFLLGCFIKIDVLCIKMGFDLKRGGSLIIVAKKI